MLFRRFLSGASVVALALLLGADKRAFVPSWVIIDASTNPQDIGTPAEKTADRILVDFEEARRGNPKAPFYAYFGEDHANPASILLGVATLSALHKKRPELKVGYTYELPHDTHIHECNGVTIAFREASGKNVVNVGILYAACAHMGATARQLAFASIAQMDKPVALVDVSTTTPGIIINQNDQQVRRIARELFPEKDVRFTVTPEGMAIRNKAMFENMTEFQKQEGLDLVIHQGGYMHLSGFQEYRFSYEESLSGLAGRAGVAYTVVTPLLPQTDKIFHAVNAMQQFNWIAIEGLDNSGFVQSQKDAERVKTEELVAKSGGRIPVIDLGKAVRDATRELRTLEHPPFSWNAPNSKSLRGANGDEAVQFRAFPWIAALPLVARNDRKSGGINPN